MLKRVDESSHPCRTPTVVPNQSPLWSFMEVFDDSDKVGADVVAHKAA